jgi:hypothetical protein
VGTKIISKLSELASIVHKNQTSELVFIVQITQLIHNLTSQLPVVVQDDFTTILYFLPLVNVSNCLSVKSQLVCVAPVAPVAHQAQTVQSVSLVNVGLLTRLLPHKPSIVVILSILLFDIHNI